MLALCRDLISDIRGYVANMNLGVGGISEPIFPAAIEGMKRQLKRGCFDAHK